MTLGDLIRKLREIAEELDYSTPVVFTDEEYAYEVAAAVGYVGGEQSAAPEVWITRGDPID